MVLTVPDIPAFGCEALHRGACTQEWYPLLYMYKDPMHTDMGFFLLIHTFITSSKREGG